MQQQPPTIYLVDDDELALWLYRRLLGPSDATLKMFTSPRDFLDAYVPGYNQCLICDLNMPDLSGLDVQRKLVETGATLPIIFVSAYSTVPAVVEAIQGGAFDFLEKPVDASVLLQKVDRALEHSRHMQDVHVRNAEREAKIASLTKKERQIAERVVAGRSSREISEELGISVRTVENHRARILEKLQIRSSVELVHMLYECN
jgi:two-component system, LuxR family, response regulator FixJ